MNRDEAAKILAVIRNAWPDMKVTEGLIDIWAMAFDDMTYDHVQTALLAYVKEGEFPPKPAHLRHIIADAHNTVPEWEACWAEVERTIKTWGTYISHDPHPSGKWPGWSSRLVGDAVRHVGGYEVICAADRSELGTIRAQFRDYLKGIKERERKRITTGLVPGAGFPALDKVTS